MPRRILLIDDEPYILRALTFALKKEGYEIATAANGEEALEKIETFAPSLVFVDAMMPKKDGYQVCREVRDNPSIEVQPYIIMLTARGQETDRQKAQEAGINEFMTKPFSPSQLIARVREILLSDRLE